MKRGEFKGSSIAISLEGKTPVLPKGVKVTNISLQNPVSNLDWEYLEFTNSKVFSPAAEAFNTLENRYTNAIPGTTEYKEFWSEERRRCIEGYEVDNIRISGEHYFYLNYCQIDKYDEASKTKQLGFPNFTLMDYYWFLELEKCEYPERFGLDDSERKGIILAKARRKGWSFKNAAGLAWKYTFFKKSYCIIASYLKDYAEATFKMTSQMLNFLNEYTEFRHPRLVDKQNEIESGWILKHNGQDIKKGYRSVIKTMTFKDSGFKSVGKSATRMIFEEAGLFENLIQAYTASEPLFREGTNMIGIPIIFGTGGDMDKASQDFHKMFYNPGKYGLAEYSNIYDENVEGKCGLFIDEMWYRPGNFAIEGTIYKGVDANGNPNRWAAEVSLDRERAQKMGAKKRAYTELITQKCKTPKEAFMVPDGNIFPTQELYNRLARLKSEDHYKAIGTQGRLFFSDSKLAINGVEFAPDFKLSPIHSFPLKDSDEREGCIVIYEPPIEVDGQVPPGLYIIGHDPFAVDSEEAESLGATFVLKTTKYLKHGFNEIVAAYVGRPSGGNSMGQYNLELEKLSHFYGNAKIMFENDRGSVLDHFTKRKKLHLLADEPGTVLTKLTGKKWQGTRIKGCSMGSEKMKQQGELYVYDWLLQERGKNNEDRVIYNLDLIPDVGLLEELIRYSRDGNYDRVSALFQVVIALEDNYNKYAEEINVVKAGRLDFLTKNKNLFQYSDEIYKAENFSRRERS